MSRLKKKIIKDLFLADCVAGWKERGSALLLWAGWKPSDVGQPGKKTDSGRVGWWKHEKASSFHQVAPVVFTVYGLSSSACLIPLVFINTCFELLVNKTEHRYECVIKRWENGLCWLQVVFVFMSHLRMVLTAILVSFISTEVSYVYHFYLTVKALCVCV